MGILRIFRFPVSVRLNVQVNVAVRVVLGIYLLRFEIPIPYLGRVRQLVRATCNPSSSFIRVGEVLLHRWDRPHFPSIGPEWCYWMTFTVLSRIEGRHNPERISGIRCP